MTRLEPPESWVSARKWVWILALTMISIVKTGYCVFCDNHATQLPLVYKLQDTALFPGDPFLGAMEGYMGWVWWLVARLNAVVGIEPILAVLFVFTRVLLLYSAARLASDLVPESKTAPFLAALLMALGPYPILADGTLVEMYWEQSSMFMPLFVLALALLLEGKPLRFFACFAIGYLVNPLYGSWAAVFFVATYLVDPARASLKRVLLASPLFVVLVAPILLGGVGVLSQPNVDMDLWMWVNRLLISPHAFPGTWATSVFWHFFLFSVLVLVAGRLDAGRRSRLGRLTVTWTGLAWIFLATAFVAATGLSRALLVFQPARASEMFYLAGGITIAAVGGDLAEKTSGWKGFVTLLVAFSSLAYLLVPEFREYAAISSFVLGAVLAVGLWSSNRRGGSSREKWVLASCVWLLFASGLTVSASLARRVKHQGSLARAMYRQPAPDIAALAEWARTRTAPDAVFFHDPIKWQWAQFRYLARRPVFTTWKDASAVLWDPGYAKEWAARFAAFGFRDDLRDRWDLKKEGEVTRIRRNLVRHYEEFSAAEMRAMASDYRIDYWIAPTATPSDFPEVARAGAFKVLDVR